MGPSSLIYCGYGEVSQTHCLEEQLHTCSKACSIILKNRPSLSHTGRPTDTSFYDLLIYKPLEKSVVQGTVVHNHILTCNCDIYFYKGLVGIITLWIMDLEPKHLNVVVF